MLSPPLASPSDLFRLLILCYCDNNCLSSQSRKRPSMKDAHDNQTPDLLPIKRPRGRPRTGKAMTQAERQAKYRAKQAENTITVTFNREDVKVLKTLLANPPDMLCLSLDNIDRLAKAVFDACLAQGR